MKKIQNQSNKSWNLFYAVKDTIVHPDERNCQKNMPAKNTQDFSWNWMFDSSSYFFWRNKIYCFDKKRKISFEKKCSCHVSNPCTNRSNCNAILAISPQLGFVYQGVVDEVWIQTFSNTFWKLWVNKLGEKALFIFDNALCYNLDYNYLPDQRNMRKLPSWPPYRKEKACLLWQW